MDLVNGSQWHVHLGDCIPHMMDDMPEDAVDMAVFSPPFPALFCYTSEAGDIGNVDSLEHQEAWIHLGFFFSALLRVMKPGRVVVCHVAQIPALKRAGGFGQHDFRGIAIRIGRRAGFHYEYDWAVRKNPQAQAIRTRSHRLQFQSLERDRAQSCGCIHDYLIKFRKPGENAVPINSPGQVSREQWIKWAEGTWWDINETDTLNVRTSKSEDDVKHICPLQLEVIDRVVRLFSNPGEVVYSPFAGIGSEGVVALKRDRRFYGCELKPEYHTEACRNLSKVEASQESELTLF